MAPLCPLAPGILLSILKWILKKSFTNLPGDPDMTTAFNGADAMVRMLQLNGVKHIFGLCGDTSLPF
jgi:hypothetical protein